METAIGIRHAQIEQKSQGFMAGSFNTREYFHGATPRKFKSIKWIFLVLVFPVPLLLLSLGLGTQGISLLMTAFMIQYIGLLAERWFFFAQANHPQNLYYQTV
jgi:DMSO reductase anchor subunit